MAAAAAASHCGQFLSNPDDIWTDQWQRCCCVSSSVDSEQLTMVTGTIEAITTDRNARSSKFN